MAKSLNAADVASSWELGVNGKGRQNYTKGVQGAGSKWKEAVSNENAKAEWERGVQEALQRNAWQTSLERVNASTWEQAATTRGAANYVANTPKAKSKYQSKMQPVLDVINQTLPQVHAMPKATFDEAMDRARAMALALRNAKLEGRI